MKPDTAKPFRADAAHPLVSLALPVYNGERYLALAIEACLAQTYRDIELVISDNASTDATESICRRYAERDDRVRYIRQARNLGAAPNFNVLFEHTRGAYFKWVACDDLMAPTYIERCVELLLAHPDASLAHSGAMMIDAEGAEIGEFECDFDYDHDDVVHRFKRAVSNPDFHGVFGVMPREVVRKTRLYRMYSGADRYLLADVVLQARPRFVREPLFLWRRHDANFSGKDNLSNASAVAWWSTDIRRWPMRETVRTLLHGTSLVWTRPLRLGQRLDCWSHLIRHVTRPVVRKLMRTVRRPKQEGEHAGRVRQSI